MATKNTGGPAKKAAANKPKTGKAAPEKKAVQKDDASKPERTVQADTSATETAPATGTEEKTVAAADPAFVETEKTSVSVDLAIEVLAGLGYQVVKTEETVELDTRPVVVIPYKKSAAAGEELRYTLRAWEKYLPDAKIVIIGDKEDWFTDDVVYIEMAAVDSDPQLDVTLKMMLAISSEEIPSEFIWSNDDIVPVSPVHLSDIKLLKANGVLQAKGDGVYATNKRRTIQALKEANRPAWDYSTHTPFCFDKTLLAEVIETYKAEEAGQLVSSLYFNHLYRDIKPVQISGGRNCFFTAQVYRGDAPREIIKEVFAERKYINYNDRGYPAVLPFLKAVFPGKSRFEV